MPPNVSCQSSTPASSFLLFPALKVVVRVSCSGPCTPRTAATLTPRRRACIPDEEALSFSLLRYLLVRSVTTGVGYRGRVLFLDSCLVSEMSDCLESNDAKARPFEQCLLPSTPMSSQLNNRGTDPASAGRSLRAAPHHTLHCCSIAPHHPNREISLQVRSRRDGVPKAGCIHRNPRSFRMQARGCVCSRCQSPSPHSAPPRPSMQPLAVDGDGDGSMLMMVPCPFILRCGPVQCSVVCGVLPTPEAPCAAQAGQAPDHPRPACLVTWAAGPP
jgi:hypothetical protein